jgi:FxsC-like protein
MSNPHSFPHSFLAIVDRVTERIIALVQESPLDPSAVPDIEEMESRLRPRAPLAYFVVAVAAPTRRAVPQGGDPGSYGDSSTRWQPFRGQEFALAEYAQQVAERHDFQVEFTSIEEACNPAAGKPGIILIDPWFVADGRRAALQSALHRLPPWVLPLLVDSSQPGTRGGQLAAQVRRMLSDVGAQPAESIRRVVRSVSSLKDFVAVVPALVAEAERRYLRHGGSHAPTGQSAVRRRLSAAAQPDKPTSTPRLAGEAPDA